MCVVFFWVSLLVREKLTELPTPWHSQSFSFLRRPFQLLWPAGRSVRCSEMGWATQMTLFCHSPVSYQSCVLVQRSLYGGPPPPRPLTDLEGGFFITKHRVFGSEKVMAIRGLQWFIVRSHRPDEACFRWGLFFGHLLWVWLEAILISSFKNFSWRALVVLLVNKLTLSYKRFLFPSQKKILLSVLLVMNTGKVSRATHTCGRRSSWCFLLLLHFDMSLVHLDNVIFFHILLLQEFTACHT